MGSRPYPLGHPALEHGPMFLEDFVKLCVANAEKTGHQRERHPYWLVERVVRYGFRGPTEEYGDRFGVWAYLLGVANDGVDWTGERKVPDDPAGDAWAGQPTGNGKHWIDRTMGLGKAHIDGRGKADDDLDDGSLEKVYDVFGTPHGFTPELGAMHIGQIMRSDWRADWLRWADLRVTSLEFHVWSVRYWLGKYWAYGFRQALANERAHAGRRPINWVWVVESAAAWSRFANSAIGAAWPHAGKPAHEIDAAYYEYKREERGEESAKRTLRQIGFAQRAVVVVDKALIQQVEVRP